MVAVDELTPRELEVIECVREGARTRRAIGRRLDPPISHRTVEAHLESIARKLPRAFEEDSPPFWRIVLWSIRDEP